MRNEPNRATNSDAKIEMKRFCEALSQNLPAGTRPLTQ